MLNLKRDSLSRIFSESEVSVGMDLDELALQQPRKRSAAAAAELSMLQPSSKKVKQQAAGPSDVPSDSPLHREVRELQKAWHKRRECGVTEEIMWNRAMIRQARARCLATRLRVQRRQNKPRRAAGQRFVPAGCFRRD